MSSVTRSRAFRLDPLHAAVLGVALARDRTTAVRQWQALRARTSMEALQQGKVRRLLPLAGHALGIAAADLPHDLPAQRAGGVDEADVAALLDATAHARREHTERTSWLRPVVDRLAAAGVDVLVMKGVALALSVYPAPELRPMVDVDLLVPAPRILDVIGELTATGWAEHGALPQHHLRRGQEIDLRGPAGEKLDLHWHLHPAVVVPGLEAESDLGFFERALPLPALGAGAVMLDPTDQLFHVLVHGGTNGWRSHPLWVADAAMLVDDRNGDTFDGERFVRMTRAYGVTVPVAAGLALLRERFARTPRFVDGWGAPLAVERALDGRLTLRQRRLYAEIAAGRGTKPPEWLPRVLGPFADTYHYWATQSVTWPRERAAREFPGWLADYWRLPGPRAIPGKLIGSLNVRRPRQAP